MNKKNECDRLSHVKPLRFSKRQLDKLNASANELNMPFATYAQDKLNNGKERTTYAKRKMMVAIATANKHIDEIYELLATTDSEYISKDELIRYLKTAKKECETL